MNLIEPLPAQRWPSGQLKAMGLFECPFCNAQVTRPLYKGKQFKSCGCNQTPAGKQNPKFRHGASYEPIYQVWAGMLARCGNPKHKSFSDYGGRGIAVCPKWFNAATFILWAKQSGYRKGLMIDRIDNAQGYSPSNCRWLSKPESARNKRNTRLSMDIARAIRKAVQAGASYKELGQRFHVSSKLIGQIARGKTWKDDGQDRESYTDTQDRKSYSTSDQ